MGAQSIKIPVELELSNLRDSINTLQNALKKVDPGSAIYKKLENELARVESRMTSLEVESTKAFTKTSEIERFKKNAMGVGEAIKHIGLEMSHIKFKDLVLDKADLKPIQDYEDEIKKFKSQIDSVKIDKLKDLTANSAILEETLTKKLSLNLDSTSFEKVLSKVQKEVEDFQKRVNRKNIELNIATANKTALENKKTGLDSLETLLTKRTDPRFFDSKGGYKTGKKGQGGRQLLVEHFKELGIDEATIKELEQTSAKNLDVFWNKIAQNIANSSNDVGKAIDEANKKINAIQTKITTEEKESIPYRDALKELENINIDPSVKNVIATLEQQIRDSEEQITLLKNELIQLKGPLKEVGKAARDTAGAQVGIAEKTEEANQALENQNRAAAALGNIKETIKQWFGFNEVINLTKSAVRNAINHIRELDKVMTEIAVVTDMTQDELWDQIGTYSDMAQQYGAATAGVYEVSQLYYQQGLQTAEVMELTEETLKMAKIASLDYADATDYMTVAIRGFKLEMSDAQNIVDVYSNIAAVTASDTEELAVAMSKTASSAEAVSSSFENTTAMIALMVETTREAPENIGSAMKSIISRYGEMTTNPAAIVDAEGEALSLNKVDQALQSVGISLHDTQDQFRDFDEVILELSSKWETIDKNTQRYIATVMAGNRQQSRFLALVGNYDRLSYLYEEAANSQDAATLQTLKTMDSIETKINQLTVSVQEFYTSAGAEDLIKGFLDFANQLVQKLNDLPKSFGQLPVTAAGVIYQLITVLKNFATLIITDFEKTLNRMKEVGVSKGGEAGSATGKSFIDAFNNKIDTLQFGEIKINKAKLGATLSTIGTLGSTLSLAFGEAETESQRHINGIVQGVGSIMSAAGQAVSGNYIGAAITLVTGISQAVDTAIETTEEKADRLRKKADNSKNEALLQKSEYNNLKDYKNKLEELTASRYDSNEAYQEWIDYQNEIADKYPQLISYIDGEGNAIIDLAATYDELAYARDNAAAANLDALWKEVEAAKAEYNATKDSKQGIIDAYNQSSFANQLRQQIALQNGFANFMVTGNAIGETDGIEILDADLQPHSELQQDINEELSKITNFEDEKTIQESVSNIFNLIDTKLKEAGTSLEASIANNTLAEDLSKLDISIGTKNLVTSLVNVGDITNEMAGDLAAAEAEVARASLAVKYSEKNLIRGKVGINNLYEEDENPDFILSGTTANLNKIVEDYLIKQGESFGDLSAYAESADFSEDYDYIIGLIETGISDFSENKKTQLMEIFNNPEKYSSSVFANEIKTLLGEGNEELAGLLISQWRETVGIGLEALDSFGAIVKDGAVYNSIERLLHRLPPELANAISSQLEPVLTLKEQGNFNEANRLQNAILSIYDVIDNDFSLGADEINKYATIISQGDLTSLTGIYTVRKALEEAGYDVAKMDDEFNHLAEIINVNLDIEWQTYTEDIASNLKSFEEAVSKAAEGMDVEEATKMANQLGISLEDFRFEDGKYFVDDVEKLKETYYDMMEELKESLENETNSLKDALGWNKIDNIEVGEEGFTGLDNLDTEAQNFLNSRFEEYQEWLESSGRKKHTQFNLFSFLNKELNELNDDSNELINKYGANMIAQMYLSVGDLTNFVDTLNKTGAGINQEKLINALKTGDTSNLDEETLAVYLSYEKQLTELIVSSTENLTQSALEAISSGKGQTLDVSNLNTYNPKLFGALDSYIVTDEETGKQTLRITPENAKIVHEAVLNYGNLTIEEANAATVAFLEAQQKDTRGALEGVMSDYKKVDLSTIESFANSFGKSVQDLIEQNVFTLNADGVSYRANLDALQNIVDGKAYDAQAIINDGIREYLNNILDILSNGISGEMSNTEFTQLNEYFKNLDLSTYETAEGLKLTEQSVSAIYTELEKTNYLASQVVLDQLVESAQDSNEKLEDIFYVTEKIEEINKEINKTEINSARYKQLQKELAVTERIKDNLLSSGEAFNFMERDLPTGMTNPLSALEGVGSAFEILNGEDFAKNQIGYQDFYNMITFMGDDILRSANILKDKSTTSADLIRAAGKALKSVDGEVVVDLSALGQSFNIGADSMKDGVEKGLKALAENQIAVLDAEIQMLETVVKTNEVFESLAGDKNEIDLSEFMPSLVAGENYQLEGKWSTEEEALLAQLNSLIPEKVFKLTNGAEKTIQDLINNPELWNSLEKTEQELIVKLINAIGQFGLGNDWSTLQGENPQILANLVNSILGEEVVNVNQLISERIVFSQDSTEISDKMQEAVDKTFGETENFSVAKEIERYFNENPDKTTVELGDFIKFVAGDDVELEQKLTSAFSELNLTPGINPVGVSVQPEVEEQKISILASADLTNIEEPLADVLVGERDTYEITFTINLADKNAAEVFLTTIKEIIENEENLGVTESAINTYKDLLIQVQSIATLIAGIAGQDISITADIQRTDNGNGTSSEVINQSVNTTYTINASQAMAALGEVQTSLNSLSAEAFKNEIKIIQDSINSNVVAASSNIQRLSKAIGNLPNKASAINNTADALNRLQSKIITAKLNVEVNSPPNTKIASVGVHFSQHSAAAVGSSPTRGSALAMAKGGATSGKRTLMGELGPELVVSNGQYFTVGNSGAEFVDLPKDAIVFNHLQTEELLKKGRISGTGEAHTTERNAVALAGGNVSGPAKASAKEALESLKDIRAMWENLLNFSASDLGTKAGSGGGGGGGGNSTKDPKGYIHDLERWYNLLRQIEKLEQQISLTQAQRENMTSGYDYSESLQKELKLLEKQKTAYETLSELQKSYYDARRKDLLSTDYSLIFTYDKDGLMQYVDGKNKGLDILATLNQTDAYGKPTKTASEQLKYLKSVGFDISELDINADGTKAEGDEQRVQNFWDGVDGWMKELDELYDSYNEATTNVEEATAQMNEILQEYIDTQLSVEEKLMQAIEDREQAEIDKLQKEKDALEEASQAYIDGLSNALDKERKLYEQNEEDSETKKLQNRLAILQRSGASSSEIKSLQDQIDSRLQDSYFNQQQEQINAIQEASNNQLEKLQNQIDLMTEALEYQKENGLLWQEVYTMLDKWTPEQMLQFIEQYTNSYKEDSPLENQEKSKETLKELEILDEKKKAEEKDAAWKKYYKGLDYSDSIKEKYRKGAKKAFMEAYDEKGEKAAKSAANKYYKEATTKQKTDKNTSSKQEEKPKDTNSSKKEETKVEKITGKGIVKTESSNLNVRSKPNGGKIGSLKKNSSVVLTGYKDGWYQIDYNGKVGYVFDKYIKTSDRKKLPAFSEGGLVDFTGPAMVHGSKSKPEAFLSASDTAMLKSKIFSNANGSLKSLVMALEEITSNTSRYSTNNNNESIIIHNAQVNIQPGTISNDYDARRAGELALEEMVKIARKTTNRIVSK